MHLKSNHSLPRKPCGFALIITIVLVAFLVLVVVGLGVFMRVETAVADNAQTLTMARQNAVTGLNIAIGQLQRYAGPDQRVSARGDMVDTAAKKKNLTGIWDTTKAYGAGDEPEVWLVSGSERPAATPANTVANQVVTPSGAAPASDEVILVGANTVEDPNDYIILKKQPLAASANTVPGLPGSPTIGSYAYWIGDEGAKVSLNIIDPSEANTVAPNYAGTSDWTKNINRERLNQQMLPQPQWQSELNGIDIFDGDTLAQLEKVGIPAALRYVDGFAPTTPAAGSQKIRELFYDITPRSEAVLADLTTGDGRLKIDLSDPAVRPGGVNNYMSATPVAAASNDYIATYDVSEQIYPVISEASIRFSFYRSGGNLLIGYMIHVELWNPYAANLQLTNGGAPMAVEIDELPSDVDLATDLGDAYNDRNLDIETQGSTFTSSTVDTGGGTLTWVPGEIKVLRSNGNVLHSSSVSPADAVLSSPMTINPASTNISVTFNGINALEFRLKIGGNVVATYKPGTNFTSGTYTTSATTSPDYSLGYGAQFQDNIDNWASTADPRDSGLADTNFTNSTWTADPSANLGDFSGSDTLRETNAGGFPVVLFDLPRQELMSVGELRHLVSASPYSGANNLYDRFFMSTVPQSGWTVADIATRPLPNRYIRILAPQAVATATDADLQGQGNTAARFLMQKGAFNVNSTSIVAWKTLLGAKLNGWTYDPTGSSSINLNHAFFRLPHGARSFDNPPLTLAAITGPSSAEDTVFTGGRELTDADVTNLATEIVRQIRDRGRSGAGRPFFTLGEFVSSNLVEQSIAQVTTDTNSINSGLNPNRNGTPGDLIQSDVIAAMAPFIISRSDTFKIRSYGEVVNPVTAAVTGRAWCEAIVQRVPDLAESPGANAAAVADPDFGAGGTPFGRKFVIVSFRWLTSSDI